MLRLFKIYDNIIYNIYFFRMFYREVFDVVFNGFVFNCYLNVIQGWEEFQDEVVVSFYFYWGGVLER